MEVESGPVRRRVRVVVGSGENGGGDGMGGENEVGRLQELPNVHRPSALRCGREMVGEEKVEVKDGTSGMM